MSSNGSNLVTVGRITGVFGIKGWVKVSSFTDPKENIVKYSPWWLKTRHGVKKIEIDDHTHRAQGLVVHIKGVDDRDLAAEYAKTDIAIEKSQLPELAIGEYYWSQLIGLEVFSEFGGKVYPIGNVSQMLETGANDVVIIKPNSNSIDDRERLIPYVPQEYILEINLEENTMLVAWDPEF